MAGMGKWCVLQEADGDLRMEETRINGCAVLNDE
jgi:hypothetical protein